MGGGGRRAPVDKSQQRNDWATAQNAERARQASEYNQRVSDFNSGLQNFLSGAAQLRSRASGMNILQDEDFGAFENELNNKRSSLAGFDFTETAPDFASVVNSGIADDFSGGAVTLNVPTLQRANTSARNTAMADIDAALNSLRALRDQRTTEENRVRNALNEKRGLASGLGSQIGTLNLRDFSTQRGALAGQIGQLRSRLDSFSSPILSEFMTGDLGSLRANIDGLQSTFNTLSERERAERDRISAFSRSLSDQISGLQQGALGLTIADQAGLNRLASDIAGARAQAQGFSSELDFNFSQPLSQLDSVNARLQSLQSERAAEQQRVNQAIQLATQEALGIEQGAQGADIYNLASLTGLGGRISSLRAQAQGFSSPLGADFSNALARATAAEEAITGLRTQRQSALDALVGNARNEANIGDIPLENEQAILDRRNRLNTLQAQLGQFSGNDLGDERAVFMEAMSSFDSRLRQVADRRSAIEQRARQLQAAINNGSFLQLSDLDPRQAELAQLRAEQELFAATQALDELDAISNTLTQQRQRIERDIASRTQAQGSEREAMMRQLGLAASSSVGSSGEFTPDQIAALLSGISRRREDLGPGVQGAPASFSQLAMVA